MSATSTNTNKGTPFSSRRLIWGVAGLLFIAASAVTAALISGNDQGSSHGHVVEVSRGDLTISITETGTLRNRDQVIVSSEVEGRATILWIIDEGEMVEEGDLLVELDSSGIEDRLVEREITVQNAEAAYVRAQQELRVTRSRVQSEIDEAELAERFARLDLDKYVGDEGEHTQELDRLGSDIDIAREEMLRTEQRFRDSESLAADGYITTLELEGDRLSFERARVSLRLAEGRLKLFQDYTHHRTLQQLQSDVQQAADRLERVRMTAHADIVQAEANYKAREQELERQKQQLAHLRSQLEKCRLYAPAGGMVIYETSANPGRRGTREPLEAGQEVRERQEMIYLPASRGMIAEVSIHESALDRILPGMEARIRVDARPDGDLRGRVRRIAPMPNAQSLWLNPDLTVYSTQIEVDADAAGLRTGMSCQVEIVIADLEDVIYAPLQTIVRHGRNHYAYVIGPRGPVARPVEIGMDNNRLVHIRSGLEPGDRILLAPPLDDRIDDRPGEGIDPDEAPVEAIAEAEVGAAADAADDEGGL